MSAKKLTGRHYRQGKTKVYLRRVDNTLAVRYDKGAKAHVRKTLCALGQGREAVYIEDESQLRVIVTREINVRFKANVTEGQRTKLLKSLNLTILAPNEFHPRHYLLVPASDVD